MSILTIKELQKYDFFICEPETFSLEQQYWAAQNKLGGPIFREDTRSKLLEKLREVIDAE